MSIVWKDIVELATLSLLYDGRPVEALGFVDSVATALPGKAALWRLQIRAGLGDHVGAVAAAQEALRQGQAGPLLWRCVGQCLEGLGHAEAARLVDGFAAARYGGPPPRAAPSPAEPTTAPSVTSLADLCKALQAFVGAAWWYDAQDGLEGEAEEELPDANF
eukprot:EG_transcript_24902